MATGPRYKVAFRRRRENRTDYYARRRLLSGQEARALAAASTRELKAMGWNHSCSSIPAAYLVGYLAGKRAINAGIEYAVLDIGMQKVQHGGVLFATVAGMCDAGLEVPHGEDVLPDEDRILGKHIDEGIEADLNSLKEKMEAE